MPSLEFMQALTALAFISYMAIMVWAAMSGETP